MNNIDLGYLEGPDLATQLLVTELQLQDVEAGLNRGMVPGGARIALETEREDLNRRLFHLQGREFHREPPEGGGTNDRPLSNEYEPMAPADRGYPQQFPPRVDLPRPWAGDALTEIPFLETFRQRNAIDRGRGAFTNLRTSSFPPRLTARPRPHYGGFYGGLGLGECLFPGEPGAVQGGPHSAGGRHLRADPPAPSEETQRLQPTAPVFVPYPVTPQVCVVCADTLKDSNAVAPGCGHLYCGDCIKQMFKMSFKDEQLFPPRCCRREGVPLGSVQAFLTPEIVAQYATRSLELGTPGKDRIYCANRQCGVFISAAVPGTTSVACSTCNTKTCTACKNHEHDGECPKDGATDLLDALAKQKGWVRCPSCNRVIELRDGCNHITCKCSRSFCYVCAAPYSPRKTCNCPQYSNHRRHGHHEMNPEEAAQFRNEQRARANEYHEVRTQQRQRIRGLLDHADRQFDRNDFLELEALEARVQRETQHLRGHPADLAGQRNPSLEERGPRQGGPYDFNLMPPQRPTGGPAAQQGAPENPEGDEPDSFAAAFQQGLDYTRDFEQREELRRLAERPHDRRTLGPALQHFREDDVPFRPRPGSVDEYLVSGQQLVSGYVPPRHRLDEPLNIEGTLARARAAYENVRREREQMQRYTEDLRAQRESLIAEFRRVQERLPQYEESVRQRQANTSTGAAATAQLELSLQAAQLDGGTAQIPEEAGHQQDPHDRRSQPN